MGQLYNIISDGACQGVAADNNVLHDVDERGRERPWHVYKLQAGYISAAYADIDGGKARRVADCAAGLLFGRDEHGRLRLQQAQFCRVRLCPICVWRRSLKAHAHMMRVLAAAEPLGLSYQMVTLTVRNCRAADLSATLDSLCRGLHNLTKRAAIRRAWAGWYRGIEVTHNMADDTYHPHIHILVAVRRSYYHSAAYVSQRTLTALWRECCGLDYDPVVDMRRCYNDSVHVVSEIAKYSTKYSDIVCYDDWDITVDTLRVLDAALAKRRLAAYGGVLKQLHAALNLDDVDDGDLVNIGDSDDERCNSAQYMYWWHTGYARYLK